MRKWIALWLLVLMTLLTSAPAFAAISSFCSADPSAPGCSTNPATYVASTTPTGNNTVPNMLAGSTIAPNTKTLFSFAQDVMVAGNAMAHRFIPYALGLAILFGVIAFIWLGIMIMLSQADIWHMGIRPLFLLIMTVGFTFWFLFDYTYLTSAVVDGFLFAGNILTGVGGNSASGSAIGNMAKVLFNDVITMQVLASKLVTLSIFKGGLISDVEHFLTNIPDMLIDGVAIAIAEMCAIVIYVAFVVLYLVYQVVIGIAIAVGPVFIPFLILPATKSLFEGWLRMLIMSGIYLMTSTVIVGLAGTAMTTYMAQMNHVASVTGVVLNIGSLLGLIILELVSFFALLKTHEFAHAIGGSVSIGGINPGGAAMKAVKGAAGG